MIIVIGSYALNEHKKIREPKDLDIIGSYEDIKLFIKDKKILSQYPTMGGNKLIVKTSDEIIECEIAWKGSNTEKLIEYIVNDKNTIKKENGFLIPSLNVLYMIKMSHRFLKDSVFFKKTMDDILFMRELGALIDEDLKPIYKERMNVTYNYKHPNLNVNKDEFFNYKEIQYVYDHDSIHEAVKLGDVPAYTKFKKEGEDVFCDKNKFSKLTEEEKINAVLEESYVLALERSQIPFVIKGNKKNKITPKESFIIALSKVCTSITSGWFREFAWENYDKVMSKYNDNYVEIFLNGLKVGIVKPNTINELKDVQSKSLKF